MTKRRSSRIKKVSYILQITCDKTPETNEPEFLNLVRQALYDGRILLDGTVPRVSVTKRIEEYVNLAKEST